MSLEKNQVVDFLSNMPVIELANLIKELEEKWGVTAAAPVAIAAAPGAAAGGAPAEEKTSFDVVLADGGANKINVIKEVVVHERAVRLWVIRRDANVLIHVESHDVFETHFAGLVKLD